MQNTVLVTGIHGYLGGHVAATLLARGYAVRGSVRSLDQRAEVEASLRAYGGKLELVAATLEDDDGWATATTGCNYVVHTASPFPAKLPRDRDALVSPARDGTRRVLHAAKLAGVRRVVVTSSVASIVYSGGRAPFDETAWSEVDDPRCNAYHVSKTVAEQTAWELARAESLELVAINPGFILGPVTRASIGTSVAVVAALLGGQYPACPKLGFSTVDVRDVADAHVRAMTDPAAANERFIVAGDVLWIREIAAMLREAYPDRARKIPRREMPNWLMRAVAWFDASARPILGDLGRDDRVSHAKAASVLGWRPRPLMETVRATADSLIAFGLA